MRPDERFRVEARWFPLGGTYDLRLMARRSTGEAVVGVLILNREEYEAFRLIAEVTGLEVRDATGRPVPA